jgi:hypothetical protein
LAGRTQAGCLGNRIATAGEIAAPISADVSGYFPHMVGLEMSPFWRYLQPWGIAGDHAAPPAVFRAKTLRLDAPPILWQGFVGGVDCVCAFGICLSRLDG